MSRSAPRVRDRSTWPREAQNRPDRHQLELRSDEAVTATTTNVPTTTATTMITITIKGAMMTATCQKTWSDDSSYEYDYNYDYDDDKLVMPSYIYGIRNWGPV